MLQQTGMPRSKNRMPLDTMIDERAIRPHAVSKAQNYDMLVFCHVRWNFIYQRPHHIISRMARGKKVLFIEEPILFTPENKNTANLIIVHDNLHVLQPRVSSIEEVAAIVSEYVTAARIPVGWFYSASFVPLLQEFSFDKVIYDCMDNLSPFTGTETKLGEEEKYLMSEADVIFTGGKSLYETKHREHPNVHCLPSSVDRRHFEKALNNSEDISEDGPVIGYYGVIDETVDLLLISTAAARMPYAHFVMVGPAKISESHLPKANNIHYAGMVSYTMLPSYLKSFDIAMMPFAADETATEYISSSKTLEFMAANKPIISTPIDAVKEYSDCVHIVNNTDEFCNAIHKIIYADKKERQEVKNKFERILDSTSWDMTVNRMNDIINSIAA